MFQPQTRVPFGYLWRKDDRNGQEFYGGVLSFGFFQVPIVMFKERKRDNERSADFVIRVANDTPASDLR